MIYESEIQSEENNKKQRNKILKPNRQSSSQTSILGQQNQKYIGTMNKKKSESSSNYDTGGQDEAVLKQASRIMSAKGKKSTLVFLEQYLADCKNLRGQDKVLSKSRLKIIYTCAYLAHQLKKFEVSKKYYEKILKNHHNNGNKDHKQKKEHYYYEAMVGYGCLHEDFYCYASAQLIFREIVNNLEKWQNWKDKETLTYFNLGNAEKKVGKFQIAIKWYNKVIQKKFNDSLELDSLHNSALILNLIDQPEESIQIYRLITSKEQYRINSQFNLCQLLYSNSIVMAPSNNPKSSKIKQSQKILNKISENLAQSSKNIQNISFNHHQANIYRQMGKNNDALRYYEKALDYVVKYIKIQSKIDMDKNMENANYGWKTRLKKYHTSLLLNYAQLLTTMQRYSRASQNYTQILHINRQQYSQKISQKYIPATSITDEDLDNNPVLMINYLVNQQILNIQNQQQNKINKNYSLSTKVYNLIQKADKILYPLNFQYAHQHGLRNQVIVDNCKILQYFYQNRIQEKWGKDQLMELLSEQQQYDNWLAHKFQVKLSKLKVLRYFTNYWVYVIIEAHQVLQEIHKFDENPNNDNKFDSIRSKHSAFKNTAQKYTPVSVQQQQQQIQPRSRRRNNDQTKSEKIIQPINIIETKSKSQQIMNTKQDEKIRYMLLQLHDQLYELVCQFWRAMPYLLIDNSSPVCDDVGWRQIGFGQIFKTHEFISQDFAGLAKKITQQDTILNQVQKINTIVHNLQNKIEGDQMIRILINNIKQSKGIKKPQYERQKPKNNLKNIKKNTSEDQNSNIGIPKFIKNTSKKRILTQEMQIQQNTKNSHNLIQDQYQQSFNSLLSSKNDDKKSEPLLYCEARMQRLAQSIGWQPACNNILNNTFSQSNKISSLDQQKYKFIQKYTWLLNITLYTILIKIPFNNDNESSQNIKQIQIDYEKIENSDIQHLTMKYSSFVDKITYLCRKGIIPPTLSILQTTRLVCQIICNIVNKSLPVIIQNLKQIVLFNIMQEKGKRITKIDKEKFIAGQISRNMVQLLLDQNILKKMQEWELEVYTNQTNQTFDNKNLFISFSAQKNNGQQNNVTQFDKHLQEINIISAISGMPPNISVSCKLSFFCCAKTLSYLIQEKANNDKRQSIRNLFSKSIERTFKDILVASSKLNSDKQKTKELNKKQTQITNQVQGKCCLNILPQISTGSNKDKKQAVHQADQQNKQKCLIM